MVSDEQIKFDLAGHNDDLAQVRNLADHASNTGRNCEMMLERLNNQINEINGQFFNLKEETHAKIIKVSQEVAESMKFYKNMDTDINGDMQSLRKMVENVNLNMDKFHFSLEETKEKMQKQSQKMEAISADNSVLSKVNEATEGFDKTILKLSESLDLAHHKIYLLEEYIEKYMPMKIQSTISGTIAPVLSSKKKKLMEEITNENINSMKSSLSNPKPSQIEQKLQKLAKATGQSFYSPPKSSFGLKPQKSDLLENHEEIKQAMMHTDIGFRHLGGNKNNLENTNLGEGVENVQARPTTKNRKVVLSQKSIVKRSKNNVDEDEKADLNLSETKKNKVKESIKKLKVKMDNKPGSVSKERVNSRNRRKDKVMDTIEQVEKSLAQVDQQSDGSDEEDLEVRSLTKEKKTSRKKKVKRKERSSDNESPSSPQGSVSRVTYKFSFILEFKKEDEVSSR